MLSNKGLTPPATFHDSAVTNSHKDDESTSSWITNFSRDFYQGFLRKLTKLID